MATIHPQHIHIGFENSKLYTTKLVTAALENNVKKVMQLLNQGENPFIRTIESIPRTPLEYAERYGCEAAALVLRVFMGNNPHLEFTATSNL
jgi:ankyrin repeat protein